MTPVVKLLRLMDGEKPAMGKIYDRMFMIGAKIDEREYAWKDMAAGIHANRWEYLHSPMHSAGYALDPEFMEHQGDMDDATQTGLMTIIERICLRDEMVESNGKVLTLDSEEVQLRVSKTMLELSTYQQGEGIFTKSSVMLNAKLMAPAAWWNTYCKHLPLLSSVARRVLSQPCCASAAERNWSVYGQIKTAARSRMGHAVGDKLVYCHEALHMQRKVQLAGYKQAVEKWDTDSDSDSSDDGDLAM
jgi:hypothetical protein